MWRLPCGHGGHGSLAFGPRGSLGILTFAQSEGLKFSETLPGGSWLCRQSLASRKFWRDPFPGVGTSAQNGSQKNARVRTPGRRKEARWPAGFWAAPWGAARPLGPFPRGGRPGRPCHCLQLCPVPRTHRNCMATTPHRSSLHLSLSPCGSRWGAGVRPSLWGAEGGEGPGLRGRGMGGGGTDRLVTILPESLPASCRPRPVPGPSLRLDLISQRPLPQTGRPSGPPSFAGHWEFKEPPQLGLGVERGAEGAPDFPGGRIESRLGRHLSPPKPPPPGDAYALPGPPVQRQGNQGAGGEESCCFAEMCSPCTLSPPSSLPPAAPPCPSARVCVSLPGLMTCRSQALPEQASTNLGLEAIIRKALMGKYDQWEEPPLGANAFNALNASAGLPAAMPITAADGRSEHALTSPGLQASRSARPVCPPPSPPAPPPPVSLILCLRFRSPTPPSASELLTTSVRV